MIIVLTIGVRWWNNNNQIEIDRFKRKRKKTNYASNGIRAERRKLIFKKCCAIHTDNLHNKISCFIYKHIAHTRKRTHRHTRTQHNTREYNAFPITSMPHMHYASDIKFCFSCSALECYKHNTRDALHTMRGWNVRRHLR